MTVPDACMNGTRKMLLWLLVKLHVLCMRAEVHCAYHTLQVNGPFLGLVAFAPVEPSW